MKFGENLKRLRLKSMFTQVGFANALGVTQATVSLWESGRYSPPLKKLPEIAKLLECSIDDLFEANE